MHIYIYAHMYTYTCMYIEHSRQDTQETGDSSTSEARNIGDCMTEKETFTVFYGFFAQFLCEHILISSFKKSS